MTEEECNKFIHINVNNYDYFMLKAEPKRFYKYIPPTIYPDKKFEDISDEIINNLFKRYCLDPNGEVIK